MSDERRATSGVGKVVKLPCVVKIEEHVKVSQRSLACDAFHHALLGPAAFPLGKCQQTVNGKRNTPLRRYQEVASRWRSTHPLPRPIRVGESAARDIRYIWSKPQLPCSQTRRIDLLLAGVLSR